MASDFRGISGLPLGLRNNNPGNLRPVTGGWMGQAGTNQGFAVFDNVAWGIRAFAMNFNSSVTNHGTDTLRKYINRYAPPSENDTNGYVNKVAADTGISPDAPIPTDADSLRRILRAQMNVELGPNYASKVTDADIDEGISLLNSPLQTIAKATGVFVANHKVVSFGIVLLGVGSIYLLWRGIRKIM